MKKSFPEKLLHQPIADLDLSEDFKVQAKKYGYHTLADILHLNKPYDVLKHQGFHMVLLMEFTGFLTSNSLQHYLMPID